MAEESQSESETEWSDESDAEPREVLFEPCCDYVAAHPRRSDDHAIDAEVVSSVGGPRRAVRLRVGRDGLIVEESGHAGRDRVEHQLLMLPSVQIWVREEPGRGAVLRIAGSWPARGASLLLPEGAARSLQKTLLGLVRAVTTGPHLEVRPGLRAGPPGHVSCRDVLDARARGPLLCAGYVLYSSFADALEPVGAEPAAAAPRYSLCYVELCGPTRVGDARAYVFSSHVDEEAALLVTIIWPYAEDESFRLLRETENTVLRIGSEEQACVEPGTRSCLRRSRVESSRLSALVSARIAPWEAPMVDYLTFRSSLEARAWMDLAASVYAVGEDRQRLRDRVARNAATTEEGIRFELDRANTSLLVKRSEHVAQFHEAPMPMDPQAVRAREHLQSEGDDVARLLGQMQRRPQLPDDFVGSSSGSVVIVS